MSNSRGLQLSSTNNFSYIIGLVFQLPMSMVIQALYGLLLTHIFSSTHSIPNSQSERPRLRYFPNQSPGHSKSGWPYNHYAWGDLAQRPDWKNSPFSGHRPDLGITIPSSPLCDQSIYHQQVGDVDNCDTTTQLSICTCCPSWYVPKRNSPVLKSLLTRLGWNSHNSNTVRSRTVSAAMYNMFCQAAGIITSNTYRADDKPKYRRGNKQLVAIVSGNIIIYLLVGVYYLWVNKRRDKIWNSMTAEEKEDYAKSTKVEGNKRLDFRFAY
jgi:hypothetical protein